MTRIPRLDHKYIRDYRSKVTVALDELSKKVMDEPGDIAGLIRKIQGNVAVAEAVLIIALKNRLTYLVNWFIDNRPDVFTRNDPPMLDYAMQGGDLRFVDLVHERFPTIRLAGFGLTYAIKTEKIAVIEWVFSHRLSEIDCGSVLETAKIHDRDFGVNGRVSRYENMISIFKKIVDQNYK